MSDFTTRFSDRVADYVRYRPSYHVAVIRTLEAELGITPQHTRVVDLGCGTGISAALFLDEGYSVVGVEPNAEMGKAAEERLGAHERFRLVAGTAEHTTLPEASCDLVVAAQAFHWFDPGPTRAEMKRVLAADGAVALVWNERRTDSTEFLRAYEALLQRFGTDYAQVVHRGFTDASIAAFFGGAGGNARVFPSHQDFDLAGLLGRALSSSYVPRAGQPGHEELKRGLEDAFARHAVGGVVRFDYDTKLYFGRLAPNVG